MRNIIVFFVSACMLSSSCNYMWRKTIHGNGNISSEQRNIAGAEKIVSLGYFDVEITEGPSPSVKVEADENLIPYILTENKGDRLEIRTRRDVNLSSEHKIKVYVTTPQLRDVELAGSGNITSSSKFTGADHLHASIAGSGDITLEVNTPLVDAHIAGSGSISISGETKDARIEIAGVGDFKAENLKAENVRIHIAGSGNVRVYAATSLDVDIAGSGDVYYRGNASVKQSIAGSGTIKHLE